MAKYPLHFKLNAEASPGSQTNWMSSSPTDPDQSVFLAIPEEFDGPGGGLSPEDLYGMALLNCFVATFKVIAEASKLDFLRIETAIELTIEPDESGKPWVSKAHLTASLINPSDPAKGPRLMEKASQNCLIMNSVKTAKTQLFEVKSVAESE